MEATTVPGYHHDKEAVLRRLRRIEGQVRGLQRLVEDDAYCIDVLTQVAASTKALQSVALELLQSHLRHCMAEGARSGDPARVDALVGEAATAIERLFKV